MAVGCLVELAFKVAAGELKVSTGRGELSTAWLGLVSSGAEDGAALAFPLVRHGALQPRLSGARVGRR